jgi:hypothetical protein
MELIRCQINKNVYMPLKLRRRDKEMVYYTRNYVYAGEEL